MLQGAGPISIGLKEECEAAVVANSGVCIRVLLALCDKFPQGGKRALRNSPGSPLAQCREFRFLQIVPWKLHWMLVPIDGLAKRGHDLRDSRAFLQLLDVQMHVMSGKADAERAPLSSARQLFR